MPPPFQQLTLDEFAARLRDFRFTRSVAAVHMHHTESPTQADYAALPRGRQVEIIEGMWRFHTTVRGWRDIAQHLSIAPDGTVWTGRDWDVDPASAVGHNVGAFMFETIGNFDLGRERLTDAQRDAVIEVIARVQLRFELPVEALHFHREYTSTKSCPGTGIVKADVLDAVAAMRRDLTSACALAASRRSSVLGLALGEHRRSALVDADLPFRASQVAPRSIPQEAGDPDGNGSATPAPADAAAMRDSSVPAIQATDAATVAGARPPRRRALCVGIDKYPTQKDQLAGCVRDARLWAQSLKGVGFEILPPLHDANATEAAITAALGELVAGSAPGDVLVFHYSGHGVQLPDDDDDEGDAFDEAIVPVDFESGGLLLDDDQFQIFDGLADGARLTCFYDCCFSHDMARLALGERKLSRRRRADARRARALAPTAGMLAAHARRVAARGPDARRGVVGPESLKPVVFSACRSDEVAVERNGHGVFSVVAAPLVAEALAAGLSNIAFLEQIVQSFEEPGQHPGLDCRERALTEPLLGGRP